MHKAHVQPLISFEYFFAPERVTASCCFKSDVLKDEVRQLIWGTENYRVVYAYTIMILYSTAIEQHNSTSEE